MDKKEFTDQLTDALKDMWKTGYGTAISNLRTIADSEQMRPESAPYLHNVADFLDATRPGNFGKVEIIPILEMMGVDTAKILAMKLFGNDDSTG